MASLRVCAFPSFLIRPAIVQVALAAPLASVTSVALPACSNASSGQSILAPGLGDRSSSGSTSVVAGAAFGPQPNADFSNCGVSNGSASVSVR